MAELQRHVNWLEEDKPNSLRGNYNMEDVGMAGQFYLNAARMARSFCGSHGVRLVIPAEEGSPRLAAFSVHRYLFMEVLESNTNLFLLR